MGVSWYEAAAYAEFAGKSLPTLYHWLRAADPNLVSYIIPSSNFSSDDPAPVGNYPGMGPYGAYDLAGNAEEWCWNETEDKRYIMGGSFQNPSYMFPIPQIQSHLGSLGIERLPLYPIGRDPRRGSLQQKSSWDGHSHISRS
jgi:hypothetical protein